jgi:hypothetical protein
MRRRQDQCPGLEEKKEGKKKSLVVVASEGREDGARRAKNSE